MLTDKISDFLTRIRNGQRQKLNFVYVYKSKLIINLLNCLTTEGYIRGYTFVEDNPFYIKVLLKYDENNFAVIKRLVRVSKPSRRIYISVEDLSNFHIYNSTKYNLILSTNKGICSHLDALQKNVGGEVICKII